MSDSPLIHSLLAQLTLEEKIALTHGRFLSGGVPRLGIPPLEAADGPVGIRLMGIEPVKKQGAADDEVETGPLNEKPLPPKTTALPATLLLAATWDKQAAYDYAAIIASEMLALGKHLLLAPGINLMRDPRGGRNFEYFGEDPCLTGEMAIGYVRGLQDHAVGANLKHFVANECDVDRHYTSSVVDTRTLRELYIYPFERAIREGGAWSVMTGNNLVNGTHVAESVPLLRGCLREALGFEGVILTDWRGAYRAAESARATLDMTTGFCDYVYGADGLRHLVDDGTLPLSGLDAMVRRILGLYQHCGLLEPSRRPAGGLDLPEHRQRARSLAADGMVLLRNQVGILPLAPDTQLVVTGPGAEEVEAGTGSGLVNGGLGNCSILEGLQNALGKGMVRHLEPAEIGPAEQAVVVYCAVAPRGGEGKDLDQIALDPEQEETLLRLSALGLRLVVLLQTGSAVDVTAWHERVGALMVVWYAGQACGEAVSDLLTGRVTPSGKLPCTFGNQLGDYPCARMESWPARLILDKHPGRPGFKPEERRVVHALDAEYREAGLIGYRWFDAQGIPPIYPFGYGLSYTTFQLTEPRCEETAIGWCFQCIVTNTGRCAGAEVVQLYVTDEIASVTRAPKELRVFEKVWLAPGTSTPVKMALRLSDLAFFDVATGRWKVEAGRFEIQVGTSSRDRAFHHPLVIDRDQWVAAP